MFLSFSRTRSEVSILKQDNTGYSSKECDAFINAMKIAQVGTYIDDKLFDILVQQLATKYSGISDPQFLEDCRFSAILPGFSPVRSPGPHTVVSTKLSLCKN